MQSTSKKLSIPSNIRFQCLTLFSCVFAALFFLTLLMNNYSQNLLMSQAVTSSQDTLALHMNFIDEDLEHTSSYLISFLLETDNYQSYLNACSREEQYESIQKINSALSSHLNEYSNIGGLFFYSAAEKQFFIVSQGYDSFSERAELKAYLTTKFQTKPDRSFPQLTSWQPVLLKGRPFLIETAQYKDVYAGAWCTESFLSDPLNHFSENTHGLIFLSYVIDHGVSHIPLLPLNTELSYQDVDTPVYLSAKASSHAGNYSLHLFIPKSDVLRQSSSFNILFLLFFLLALALLTLLFGFIWHQLLIPVKQLTAGMMSLKDGNFNITLPCAKKENEFTLVTETFNLMSREIQHLKIAIYEEKLQKAHTELQYLNLQIKPHFFLNSLSVIHSLALTKHYDLIKEMASCLMNYFRYAFRVSESLVTVNEELTHVKNYLRIQELRYRSNFETEFLLDETTESANIPILTIQTFVENVIKHAYDHRQNMYLGIHTARIFNHNKEYLCVEVCDNGCGFSPQALFELNAPLPPDTIYNREHIGISNVKQRLALIYQDEAEITFENTAPGAKVRLLLPAEQKKKEAFPYEPVISRR